MQKERYPVLEGFWFDEGSKTFTSVVDNGIFHPDTLNNRKKILAANGFGVMVFVGKPVGVSRVTSRVMPNFISGQQTDLFWLMDTVVMANQATLVLTKMLEDSFVFSSPYHWILRITKISYHQAFENLFDKKKSKGWVVQQDGRITKGEKKVVFLTKKNNDRSNLYLGLGSDPLEWQEKFDNFKELLHDLGISFENSVFLNCGC